MRLKLIAKNALGVGHSVSQEAYQGIENATHALPSVSNDLLGSMITKQAHDATQHLNSTFQDFFERKLLATHGGSLSHTETFFGMGRAVLSVSWRGRASLDGISLDILRAVCED